MYRYSELQLKNKKLTRHVTEKDEQLEEMRQKVDSVSLELRKSEKAKREVSLQVVVISRKIVDNCLQLFL